LYKKITLQELEVKTVNLGQTVCVACLAQESTRQGYLTQMKIGTTLSHKIEIVIHLQLSPLLECDPTVCLPEKSKATRDLTFRGETNRRVTLQQG
jgi:hypothetical protein